MLKPSDPFNLNHIDIYGLVIRPSEIQQQVENRSKSGTQLAPKHTHTELLGIKYVIWFDSVV